MLAGFGKPDSAEKKRRQGQEEKDKVLPTSSRVVIVQYVCQVLGDLRK